MFFIGIISKKQEFNELRSILQQNMNKKEITLININKQSIENLKNVKCDAIIIQSSLENLEKDDIEEICKNSNYLIINSDIELKNKISSNVEANIITYGFNQKSTITFSSITDETALISVQRNFKNPKQNTIDVGEYSLNISKEERTLLHEILICFIIEKLFY